MMNLLLILTFKNKNIKSVVNMSNFLNKFFTFQKKTRYHKNKILKITILKSPHIHKKSQQHFEQRFLKTTVFFIIDTFDIFLLLKNSINFLFQDNCFYYQYICKNKIINSLGFLFYFYNFTVNLYKIDFIYFNKVYKNRLKIIKKYLKMTNLLGKCLSK